MKEQVYTKALTNLEKLINGIPVLDEDNEIIGWIEKPDFQSIKYAIEKYENDNNIDLQNLTNDR